MVHMTSGYSALAGAYMLGARKDWNTGTGGGVQVRVRVGVGVRAWWGIEE